MKYQEPRAISREDAETVLRSSDHAAIREVLVSLALTDTDWQWVHDACLVQLTSTEWDMRAVAATCLGHIARIHRKLDFERALPALYALRDDPRTVPYASDALDDIDRYIGLPP